LLVVRNVKNLYKAELRKKFGSSKDEKKMNVTAASFEHGA
jgi:hypothetical protein